MENNVYSLRYNCLGLDAFLPSMLVCFECLVFGFFFPHCNLLCTGGDKCHQGSEAFDVSHIRCNVEQMKMTC